MEFEYSPRHSANSAPHLLSPTHAHVSPVDKFASIKQIRRSLSRSPSKPQRFMLTTSPIAPRSMSNLSRAFTADNTSDLASKSKHSAKRTGPLRTSSRRTSPNSPLRRALSDNTNQANAKPQLFERILAGRSRGDQENMECSSEEAVKHSRETRFDEPIKIDFLKPDKLLQPVLKEHASPMKSSPLKRSDGVMNLEAASFGSPRHKRRSLHGATSFGSDFNVFEHGLDGTNSDSAESGRSSEEKEREAAPGFSSTWPTSTTSSPQRRPFSLRKSTLQQRAGPGRSRLFPEANRESIMSPALTRARSRISLDSALPFRSLDFESPFRRTSVNEPPVFFQPPAQKLYQSAPKPHPLSHALTPSSSSSSVVDNLSQQSQQSRQAKSPETEFVKPPSTFSRSLPVGALRTGASCNIASSETSSQESFATPAGYKMAKPLPQAFHSTGLISKRNRNVDFGASTASAHMPDTPSKKAAHIHITSTPSQQSALGKLVQPVHEFGSPSTPLNARNSKVSPESFGKGVNIFGSRAGAPQLTRRGSFLSVDGDDLNNSPTHRLQSQSSNDDLPPTPTKSTSATALPRPQSKGKSNSLRSSLFGRRTSLGPDTFASPVADDQAPTQQDNCKYNSLLDTPCSRQEKQHVLLVDDIAMPFIDLAAYPSSSPSPGRNRSLSYEQISISPMPLAKRPPRSVLHFRSRSNNAKPLLLTAPNISKDQDGPEKQSPHTPQESFTPPDPSSLSISAEQRPSTAFGGRSAKGFQVPATPTGPRGDHAFASTYGTGHASSGYFANDVDTTLTSRFAHVTTSGIGEFSQVYRVEKPLPGAKTGSQTQLSPGAQVWAVKKARKPYTGNKDRARKMREVQILEALRNHEHIVELVDFWEAKNHLYIQTEFCENGNLKDFLLHTGYKGRLDDFRIWKILLELSQGVKSIHDATFIHLDLKPANIFIDWEGVLKIGDFGMASVWPAPPGLDGEGDREYIGPEVLWGRFDKPADIFALGMIMLETAGNIVLPDNGASWQRLRAGDLSDLPSLTWTSDSSLVRDESGDPVEMVGGMSNDSMTCSVQAEDDLDFLRPAIRGHRRKNSRDLVTPPNFMVDQSDKDALDQVVQWMISPDPDSRPTVDQLLMAGGVQWVERRRRAGATVYEGSWGPADVVVDSQHQDIEMMDI